MSTKIPPEYVIVQKAAILPFRTAAIVLAGDRNVCFSGPRCRTHTRKGWPGLGGLPTAYMDTTEAETCGNGKTQL